MMLKICCMARPTLSGRGQVKDDHQSVVDSLAAPATTPEQCTELLQALQTYRLQHLQELQRSGYRIAFKPLRNDEYGRNYAWLKRIVIDPTAPDRRGTIIHEVAHALDHLAAKKGHWLPFFTAPSYASERDGKLQQLYHDYLARVAATHADRTRQEFKRVLAQVAQPQGPYTCESERYWPPDPQGVEVVEQLNKSPQTYRSAMVNSLIGIGELIAAAAYAHTHPHFALLFAGGAIVQAALTRSAWKRARLYSNIERTAEHVHIVRQGNRERVEFNKDLGPLPDMEWSPYAAQSFKVQEYLAEGVRCYQDSPASRSTLETLDAGLHAYLRDGNLASA